MSSGGQVEIPTVSGGDHSEKATKDSPIEKKETQEPIKWQQALPEKVKHVIWTIKTNSSKVYESTTTTRTMKYLAIISAVILFFALLSLILSQHDEPKIQIQSEEVFRAGYPVISLASVPERQIGGVPGEPLAAGDVSGFGQEVKVSSTSTESSVSTEPTSNEETVVHSNVDEENSDEEEKNSRIVFIERLMGLHLSDARNQENDDNIDDKEKVKAHWSHMRKFTIPFGGVAPVEEEQVLPVPSNESPNPLLRFAAAAMISRMIAAAASAQMEAQMRQNVAMNHFRPIGGPKDKDEEPEDGTVPVLLATMNERKSFEPSVMHSVPPMYGKPVIQRHSMIRPFVEHVLPSVDRQRPSIISTIRREQSRPQPVIVMLAMPIGGSENQMNPHHTLPAGLAPLIAQAAAQASAINSLHHRQPVFQPNLISRHVQYQNSQSYAMPVHMPPPPPPAGHYNPFYQPQSRPVFQPINHQRSPASSIVRPIVEVPVEIPLPFNLQPSGMRHQHGNIAINQQQQGNEQQDQIVVVYDTEVNHGEGNQQNGDNNNNNNNNNNNQQDDEHEPNDNNLTPIPVGPSSKFLRAILSGKTGQETRMHIQLNGESTSSVDNEPDTDHKDQVRESTQPAFIASIDRAQF